MNSAVKILILLVFSGVGLVPGRSSHSKNMLTAERRVETFRNGDVHNYRAMIFRDEYITIEIQGSEAVIMKDRIRPTNQFPGVIEDFSCPETRDKEEKFIILSSRTGMGKSFLSYYMAYFLAESQERVFLADLDESFSSLTYLFLNNYSMPRNNRKSIPGQYSELLIEVIPGLDFLSRTVLQELCQKNRLDEPSCMFKLFKETAPYDYIITDTQTGLNEITLSLVEGTDHIIMITTPDATSVFDTYSLIKAANSSFENKNIYLVLNQVVDTDISLKAHRELNVALQNFSDSEIQLLGMIPEDLSVSTNGTFRNPDTDSVMNSPALRTVRKISDEIRKLSVRKTSLTRA